MLGSISGWPEFHWRYVMEFEHPHLHTVIQSFTLPGRLVIVAPVPAVRLMYSLLVNFSTHSLNK